MEIVSETRCFGGVQGVYKHTSKKCRCEMTFAVFTPPQARQKLVPCLWYLSGLTCTHENAMTKAGLQSHAAKRGIAIVYPDTSPRGEGVADDKAYDLGQGAGFYVDASEAPWAENFNMLSYIKDELRNLVEQEFPVNKDAQGMTGHSMGGHGAITIALSEPDIFKSLSAFAPISHPVSAEWGRKQLRAYLGENEDHWANHDSVLMIRSRGWSGDILVDQGSNDQFIDLLKPETLASALVESRVPSVIRLQCGYDHSYNFVASFGADHINWHADRLYRLPQV